MPVHHITGLGSLRRGFLAPNRAVAVAGVQPETVGDLWQAQPLADGKAVQCAAGRQTGPLFAAAKRLKQTCSDSAPYQTCLAKPS